MINKEAILDIEIESLELDLNTELLPDFMAGKKSRVEVRTRIYNNNINEGDDYQNLRKTICIWILDGAIYVGNLHN